MPTPCLPSLAHRPGRALRALALIAGLAALPAVVPVAAAQTAAQKLPSIRLNAGIHNIQAEVARTPDERSTGLMFRETMGPNDGMLFIFEQPATQCFWMKNTLLPLSAAFLADDGTIVNVEDMQPKTLNSHCSTKPVRYVLEMHQGWFAKRGLQAGTAISGEPFAKR